MLEKNELMTLLHNSSMWQNCLSFLSSWLNFSSHRALHYSSVIRHTQWNPPTLFCHAAWTQKQGRLVSSCTAVAWQAYSRTQATYTIHIAEWAGWGKCCCLYGDLDSGSQPVRPTVYAMGKCGWGCYSPCTGEIKILFNSAFYSCLYILTLVKQSEVDTSVATL